MKNKDALADIEHTFYDVFHSMSQPSMRGKNWGNLLEYAKAQLMPKIRALQSRTIPSDVSATGKIEAAYKRYPDLVLNGISPDEVAKMFEMAVLLNTEYTQKSFVHKMLLQGAHVIRQLNTLTAIPGMREAPEEVTVEEFKRRHFSRSDFHTDTEYGSVNIRWDVIADAIIEKFPNGLRIKEAPKGGES